jgi:GNAT superfamily N-acetyltransferase
MTQAAGVTVRDYNPVRDIDGVYRAFCSGFGHVFWPMIEEADPELIKDVVRALSALGNHNLVADADGEAVGILAGCVGIKPRLAASAFKQNLLVLLPRIIMNQYNATRKARKHIQLVNKNYLPFSIKSTPTFFPFCEVLLFVIVKEYRGRGVGRLLMDEYVRRVRDGGGKRAVVLTDSELSWWFYQAYGFKRIKSYPLRDCYAISRPGREVTGYSYLLKVGPGPDPADKNGPIENS